MRCAFPILLWLLAVGCCCAQQQDKTLSERINESPNRHPYPNDLSNKQFKGGADLNVKSATEQTSTFSTKDFNSGTFETRSFFGIKNPWFGNKVYATDSASLLSKNELMADKKYAVDAAKTKDFDQSGKKVDTKKGDVKTEPFLTKGAAQGGVDQLKKNLTIDDVREILNKNH